MSFQEEKDYMLSIMVSTVHLSQQNLKLETNNGSSVYEIEIPYTLGEWQETEPIEIEVGSLSTMKFYRRKASDCFGLAIKEFILTPC